jgi:hypothetical protein
MERQRREKERTNDTRRDECGEMRRESAEVKVNAKQNRQSEEMHR